MRMISTALLVAFGFIFIWSIPVDAAGESCPLKIKGVHNSGQYRFGFQSTTLNDERTHFICHCLRNYNSERGMFFDWEETGLKGFVVYEDDSFACMESTRAGSPPKDVPLWYGTSPLRIDVPTVLPQADDAESKQYRVFNHQFSFSPGTRLTQVATGSADYLTGTKNRIVSRSKIAVPLEQNQNSFPLPHGQDLIIYAEVNPEILQTFEMEFSSTPSNDAETGNVIAIEHACRWKVRGNSQFGRNWKGYQFLMKFEDPKLQKQMFGGTEPEYFDAILGKTFGFEGKVVLLNGGAVTDSLIRKSTKLQIIAPSDREVVGTLPVTYYTGD